MLSSLRARTGDDRDSGFVDNKSGMFIYDGKPANFHEWEFRTMAKYMGLIAAGKDDDARVLGSKVLEGLRDDAYLVARHFGLDALIEDDGIPKLVKAMRDSVFPFKEEEAQMLYQQGQKEDGVLSRQSG